jgi:FkbH-like protein
MYEYESGFIRTPDAPFLGEGRDLEKSIGAKILRRCLTVWQEHCSECAMPDCYSRCAFYSPRLDYKCRRFEGGVEVLPGPTYAPASLRFKFGKWARLMGYGPTPLIDVAAVSRTEKRALRVAEVLNSSTALRGIAAPLARRNINRRSEPSPWRKSPGSELYLVIEAYNDQVAPITLTIGCKVLDSPENHGASFRAAVTLRPGYSATLIPVSRFVSPAEEGKKFSVELAPANDSDTPRVAFGVLDIVELSGSPHPEVVLSSSALNPSGAPARPEPAALAKIKCVVWDLDNTLWRGTLIEDGLSKLQLRPQAVHLVVELDKRGILQSVASKNNREDALEALRHFGLAEYFLHPQISWEPKSLALSNIRKQLNIGIDTFAFIDDLEFERREVAASHPEVMAIDSAQLDDILSHARFLVDVTSESSTRRLLYQQEGERNALLAAATGTYEDFLRSCLVQMEIALLVEADVARASELAQRTNQLNIGANRYTREQLTEYMSSPHRAVLTVRASDKFGSYGLVGLCVVDLDKSLIVDLMFSCRVQGKLVDDTFVAWLLERYASNGRALSANFVPTKKNQPARDLLTRSGFVVDEAVSGPQVLLKSGSGRSFAELATLIGVTVVAGAERL